jgi:flagellar biosynthetic protein FlhB
MIESPALARAVYHHTKVGQEIPVGLYQAVAVVLRYAYRLRGHPGFRDAPRPGEDLPIPEPLVVEPR